MQFSHTTKAAAGELGVCIRTLYRLRSRGILKAGEHYQEVGAGVVNPHMRWNPAAVQKTMTERAQQRFAKQREARGALASAG